MIGQLLVRSTTRIDFLQILAQSVVLTASGSARCAVQMVADRASNLDMDLIDVLGRW
jgi:hypothetical protein